MYIDIQTNILAEKSTYMDKQEKRTKEKFEKVKKNVTTKCRLNQIDDNLYLFEL